MTAGVHRRFDHARPITAAARRHAIRAGWQAAARPGAPATGAVGLQLVGPGRRPPRWLALPALIAVAVVAVAAWPHGDDPARTAADVPASAGTVMTGSQAARPTAPPVVITPAPSPAATSATAPPGDLTGYRWPLDHARITAWFGPRSDGMFIVGKQKVHDGLDISTFCGDRIEAAHDGVVLVAGRRVDAYLGWVGSLDAYHARLDSKDQWGTRAIMVILDDGNGYRSVYIHLSLATVKRGDQVRAGDLIGYEGRTGDATGCHLHYSVFAPAETSVWVTDPALVKRYKLPSGEIARIDPLAILPPMASADVIWGWGARD